MFQSNQAVKALTTRLAWRRTFAGFIALWLIFGSLLQAGSATYSTILYTHYSNDQAYQAYLATQENQTQAISNRNPPEKLINPTSIQPTIANLATEAIELSGNNAPLPDLIEANAQTAAQAKVAYGQLPLSFEANQGQFDDNIKFLARNKGYAFFLTQNELVLSLQNPKSDTSNTQTSFNAVNSQAPTKEPPETAAKTLIRLKLLGSNPEPELVAHQELPGKSNYFMGNDPANWHTDISNYARIEYKAVYPGIDMVFYGTHGELEYDFVIAPGADPKHIQLSFEGLEKLETDAQGNLLLHTPTGIITQRAPQLYQEQNGVKTPIVGHYQLKENEANNSQSIVTFVIDKYDLSQTLTIDPALSYSTYLGSTGSDEGYGIKVDSSGNAYIVGRTQSSGFPTTTATTYQNGWDVFVTKLNAAGNALSYSTFIGGSSDDSGNGIAIDSSGNAYLVGTTASSNFPTTTGAYSTTRSSGTDAFITKLNSTGGLAYSSYFGGNGDDVGNGIAVDSNGVIYLIGTTGSSDLSLINQVQNDMGGIDAFIIKLNPTLTGTNSLLFTTYLGSNGNDSGQAIVIDGNGSIFVTGKVFVTFQLGANGFPIVNGFQDVPNYPYNNDEVFVAKITFAGSTPTIAYSSLLGGRGDDIGYAIAIDNFGYVYIAGESGSTLSFPTKNDYPSNNLAGKNAFAAKINPGSSGGNSLIYSTFLGGSGDDIAYALAVNGSGQVYVTGETSSSNFPTTTNAISTTLRSSNIPDVFVTKLSSTGNGLIYSTYLGGTSSDSGRAIALDSLENVYLTGFTSSSNYPTTFSPYQSSNLGSSDVFITKFATDTPVPDLTLSSNDITYQQYGVTPNQLVTPTVLVHNSGSLTATANLKVTEYALTLDGTSTVITSYTTITSYTLIRFGQQSVPLKQPNTSAVGEHRVCVEIVNVNPAESLSTNNLACRNFMVLATLSATPYLIVTTQDLNTWQGGKPLVIANVKNSGGISTTITQANLQTNLSGLILTLRTPLPIDILPGQEVQLSFGVDVPTTLPGSPTLPLKGNLSVLVSSTNIGVPTPYTFNSQNYVLNIEQSAPTFINVTTVDTNNQLLNNVLVLIEGNEKVYVTSTGNNPVTISADPGVRRLYVYAGGYIAQQVLVTLTNGTNTPITITLQAGKTVEVSDITAYPLTAAEVTARGVVVTDSNLLYYDFTLYLKTPDNAVTPVVVPNVPTLSNPSSGSSSIAPTFNGGYSIGGQITYFNGGRLEDWIIIPGRFNILKQFWEASVYIKNNAQATNPDSIKITGGTATLTLPAGLSLPTRQPPVTETITLADIPAGSSAAATWVVQGDAVGKYSLQATFNGNLQFAGVSGSTPIAATAKSGEIEIIQPTLKVGYAVPSQVFAGVEFTLYMTVTNSSPITLYGVQVVLKPENFQNAVLAVGEVPTRTLGEMPPKDVDYSFLISYQIKSLVNACINVPPSHVENNPNITPKLIFLDNGCGGEHSFGECDCAVAHPVNPAIGNFFESYRDIDLPPAAGSSLALGVTRYYNSLDTTTGLFGKGWHSTYDMSLLITTGSVTVINPDGRQDQYTQQGSTYTAPSRANSTLTKLSASYLLTTSSQLVYTFNLTGTLQLITDRNGYQVALNYNASGDLTSVIYKDSTNAVLRTLTFTPTTNKRIALVGDGTRLVRYSYDATFTYLTLVTDTRGYPISFEYTGAGNRLNKVFDQVGKLTVQNSYHITTGRIISQTTYDGAGAAYPAYFDYNDQTNSNVFTDARGFTTTFSIDPSTRQPVGVKNALNQTRAAARNGNDNPTTVTQTNNLLVKANYNSFGKPTNISTTITSQGQPQTISSTVQYNAKNDPTSVTDPRGNNTLYQYDPIGNVTRITNSQGLTSTYGYDSLGRVNAMSATGGMSSTYGYNGLGQVSYVQQTFQTLKPGSTSLVTVSYCTDYGYTPEGWLAYQSDSYEATTCTPATAKVGVQYGYDGGGNMLTTTNQLSQTATSQYDKIGNLITSTNYLGQQTTYGYDTLRRLITTTQILASGNLNSFTAYDAAGNRISSTDPKGIITIYGYDALNRLITTTVPLAAGGQMQSINSYDISGNLEYVTRTNSTGNQVTRYQYDEMNRLITTTMGYGSTLAYQQVNIYDQNGNVTQTKQAKAVTVTDWNDPAQVVTSTTAYDSLNRPTSRTVNAWSASAGNNFLTTTYAYTESQNLNSSTDPYGITSQAQSDAAGRGIISILIPTAITGGAQTQTSYSFYNAKGQLVRTQDPLGNWSDTSYDPIGRGISSTAYTAPNGGGTALTSRTFYTDTVKPQITSIGAAPHYQRSDSFMDEIGRMLTSTVYTGAAVAYPTVPSGALNSTYTYDQQGNRLTMSDPTGYLTKYSYENTGWLRFVTQTVTVQPGVTQTLETQYLYDLLGNRLNTLDASTHRVTTTYDIHNRLTTEKDALGNQWQTSYDGLGRAVTRTDAKGQVSAYTYDNASRLLQLVSGVGTSGAITTSFSYNSGGQPLTMLDSSPLMTTSYGYDGLNRLLQVTSPQGIVKYSYDNLNRRTQLQFGQGSTADKTVSYGYDALSRPVTVSNWLTQTLVYSYTGTRLDQMAYPNGVNAAYSFDGAGRLLNINQTKAANTIFAITYTLDSRGNRTAATENISGTARTLGYQYDELSRLTREVQQVGSSTAVTATYSYDKVGNRQQLVSILPPNTKSGGALTLTTNYGYDVADRMITSTLAGGIGNSFSFDYDPNGSLITQTNLITGGEKTAYSYDTRNRLTQVQVSKNPTTTLSTAGFTYDGRNTRLSMSYGGKTTSYLQDATGLPVVLQENVGGQVSSFMYPLGSTSPLFQSDVNNSPLWYHADGLGSVRALTGASGNVLDSQAYGAFGTNATGGQNGKVANDHLYAGEQLDPTGLYFNRARYYNPNIGRFIGRDTYAGEINKPISQHRYMYVENNPVNWSDPSGEAANKGYEKAALAIACAEAWSRALGPFCDYFYDIHTYYNNLKDGGLAHLEKIGISLERMYIWGNTKLTYAGGRADIITRNDWKWSAFPPIGQNLFLCQPQKTGGIYEVEPLEDAGHGLAQAALNVWLANQPEAKLVNPIAYAGLNWQLGIGLLGFSVVVTLTSTRAMRKDTEDTETKMKVWYAGPGLILFDVWEEGPRKKKKEYDEKKNPLLEPDWGDEKPPWWPRPGPWPWPPKSPPVPV